MAPAASASDRRVRAERRVASVGAARAAGTPHTAPTDGHDDVAIDGDVGVDDHTTGTAAPATEPCAPTAAPCDDKNIHRRRRARGPEVPPAGRGENLVSRRSRIVVARKNRLEHHLLKVGLAVRSASARGRSAGDEEQRRQSPRHGASDAAPFRFVRTCAVHDSDGSTCPHTDEGSGSAAGPHGGFRALGPGRDRPHVAYRGASLGRRHE